ncbi:conserved exported protein of unknown function [Pseudorhizobium banfieldiae]|uniref:Uncharacterized protein n=1 Tax=Pseudorhizobium banfieldiae TaxID=1125847 RepID=L0NN00_9HYPH|nr:hypothetical protein [Pseudorhizobium banfieldiae]CCF21692.1 conserved exported protein of unknown function [Pseudorhizobium banfieldiae]
MPVKKHLIIAAQVLGLALVPTAAPTQQQLLNDPEIYEKDHFRKQCKIAQFGSGFMTRLDINNDGIVDAVSNHGEITCDGTRGPDCNEDGCPYNFYLRAKEGGYFMIATARVYGYDFIKRFGNMVFVMKMHPRFCERTDDKPCEMTVRVRGGRFVTISRK